MVTSMSLLMQLVVLFVVSVTLLQVRGQEEDFEVVYNAGLKPFLEMSERQRDFFLETWKLDQAWMNPSHIRDPSNPNRSVMVWRLYDKGRHDKVGYMWLDVNTWEITKNKDLVEVALEVPDDVQIKHHSYKVSSEQLQDPSPARGTRNNSGSSTIEEEPVSAKRKQVFTEWKRDYLIGEDTRIFNHNGHLFVTYNNHLQKFKRLYYAKLYYNASLDMLYVENPPIHVIFENQTNVRHQKNWIPFDYCPTCQYKYGSVVGPVHAHHHHIHHPLHHHYQQLEQQQQKQQQLKHLVTSAFNAIDSNNDFGGSSGETAERLNQNSKRHLEGSSESSSNFTKVESETGVASTVHAAAAATTSTTTTTTSTTTHPQSRHENHANHAHHVVYPPVLLFSYSLSPHVVVETHATGTKGEFNAETVFVTDFADKDRDGWKWGEMRGGTPALLVGDEYLAFFHSSGRLIHRHIITYVFGAYTYQRHPPFAITAISPEPLISNSMINESLGWSYKVIDYINFPMGFVVDDEFIYLSYGHNDKDGWMAKLNRTGLLNSLKKVETKVIGTSLYNNITGGIKRHSYHLVGHPLPTHSPIRLPSQRPPPQPPIDKSSWTATALEDVDMEE